MNLLDYASDIKVAFDIDDPELIWSAFGLNGWAIENLKNWELVETDSSGARYVAIFRFKGKSLNGTDARWVSWLINWVQGGIHPEKYGALGVKGVRP